MSGFRFASSPDRRAVVALGVVVAILAALGIGAAWSKAGSSSPATAALTGPARPLAASPTEETTTTTTLPPTTTTVAPTTTAPRAAAGPSARPSPRPVPSGGSGPFTGLGAWVDAFDFNPAHTGGNPTVLPSSVDRMAAAGVRTLYLQVSRPEDPRVPGDLIDPGLLAAFVQRAHANGMLVVGWFLPHLGNLDDDMRHLQAAINFTAGGRGFDAIGLDIEWRESVPSHGDRSARLVELSRRLRTAAAGRPVGAIVMPPVVTDVINPNFWPGYPWRELAPLFDAWLPMSYWTNRSADSGYRDAYRYTADNIRLLRRNLGNPAAPVHAIGGISDKATIGDYERFAAACADGAAIGCSIYEWASAPSEAWAVLRG
ncbi:MAG: hypothetical protein M3179_09280 [Actinomycetota bacterium]|nr:hypothetical protein [Actinomycetota bacterium]